jgi:hypothetical protein
VVGVLIDKHIRLHEVGSENNKREDSIVTFHVIGTAIRGGRAPELPIRPTINQGAP